MALLSIEQTCSLLQSIWVQGLHQHSDTTPATVALCKQQNNSKQRNNSSSGTTMTVVNSNPQGLWLERLSQLANKESLANKHAIQARPASWHDTPGQYIECTCKLTITRSIQDKHQHGIYKLSRNYHEIIWITWHEQPEHNTARTI